MRLQIPSSVLSQENVDLEKLTEKILASPSLFRSLLRDHPELTSSLTMHLRILHANSMNGSSAVKEDCLHLWTKIRIQPIPCPPCPYLQLFTSTYLHLRTVQNIFILNLAISDVIVCLLSLPFTPVTNIYKNWLFGQPICHLLPLVQAVSVFVSTFSLSAIAIDRYNLVVRPYAHPIKVQGATLVAIVLWAFSVVVSLPYAYYMTLEQYPGYCGQFCSEHWPNQVVRRGYALIVLTLQFLIPFMTMSFCYATIFSRLRQRANSKLKKLNERSQLLNLRSGEVDPVSNTKEPDSVIGTPSQSHRTATPTCSEPPSMDDQQRISVLASQRRTTTILASMVLIFGLTWLPQNVVTLIIEYDDSILQLGSTNYTYLISMITHSIAMTTLAINPVLYAWLNPTFKRLFLEAFKRSGNKGIPLSNSPTNKSFADAVKLGTVIKINGFQGDKQEAV
uniref:G-protein coupled receptors family 1 profile domain-containing protein n=1 Tax=Ditylenchus dipsaci TaxID=166011 RepID=A0A915CVJ2_9BILA